MSISSELLTLQNTKTAIRTAINNKGGSVGASDTFASYATAIDNLPSGGSNADLIDLIERDITSINIPSGTTRIGTSCFDGCSSLTSVIMPNSVTAINDNGFRVCTALSSVTFSENLTIIGQNAFQYCNALTSLVIPNSVTTIQDSAFYYCTSLTSVTLGNGLTALQGNNGNFRYCNSLTKIISLATTPPTLGINTFADTNNCPIYVPAESVEAYKTSWVSYASRIYPIQQVATVDGNPVYNYDLGMTSTTMITSTNMQKMPTGTSLELAEGIVDAGGSFGNYTSITLPSTFTSFDDQDMIGSTTTTLVCKATTPPTAERDRIGGSNLTEIYVPAESVDTYKADSGWSNFASIIQAIPVPPALKWTSDSEAVPDETYEISIACEDLETPGTLVKGDRTAADPDNLMVNVYGNAEIGDCVTAISGTSRSKGAFQGCSSLLSVTIPDSVTSIGRLTFQGCSNLESINIPSSVTTIGMNAFSNCGLESVTIPDSVTEIGIEAFSNCSALYEVTIENGVTAIDNSAFYYCTSLTTINIPNSVTTIGDSAFNGCPLSSVTVNATTPPILGGTDAFGIYDTYPIYVPAESVDAYKAADVWSYYAYRIQAIPTE